MDKNLEQFLIDKYPYLFSGVNLPISENLMSFGCECDNGWFEIIKEVCEKLKNEKIIFVQIKEKFAGLRMYFDFTGEYSEEESDKIYDIIDDAEYKSLKTCEICGREGLISSKNYWYKTLCSDHRKEFGYDIVEEDEESI